MSALSPAWPAFILFLALNALLSYFPLPWKAALGAGLAGLLLCFGLARTFIPKPREKSPFQKEFLPAVPLWVWPLVGAGAVFVRFYRLTSLSVWPNYDDGLWGFFAIKFIHHWDWNPFYQDNSYPSTYAWGLALLFKLFSPSLFLVWFYPALISLLVVPMGYAAARTVCSKSHSLFVALFLAFGFWPAFVGRFGNQQILTLFWECLWLWGLGRFWAAPPKGGWRWEAPLLGAVTALGLYIYISWVAVVFFTLSTVALRVVEKPRAWAYPAAWFLGAFGLFLAPILSAGLFHNYGRIVRDIGSLHGPVPLTERLATAGGYVTCLFWRMPPGRFSYQPVWGGLLDPLLGALFFLGFLRIWRTGREGLGLWVLAGMALFFIPGILTHDVEPFRNLPLIPFLGLACAEGARLLLEGLPRPRILPVLGALVLVFAGLDFYHLAVPYHRLWDQVATWKGYAKPMERYRAFQILDQIQKDMGPGLVYSNFTPGLCDQTLSVADHSFNAAENPDLPWKDAGWAAVLVNANYKPFLSRRFPDGKAFYLSQDLDASDGGVMLWMMPVTPQRRAALLDWQAAQEAFCCFPGRYYEILRDNLAQSHPAFQKDPFLESCYWEKLADLDFRVGKFKDTQKPLDDLEAGLKSGYGAAHLYYRMGVFQLMSGRPQEAVGDFRKALAAPLDLTSSRSTLRSLGVKP